MIAVAPTYQLNRWRMQKCCDTYISGLEHARFAMTAHAGHGGCALYLAALRRTSGVCG